MDPNTNYNYLLRVCPRCCNTYSFETLHNCFNASSLLPPSSNTSYITNDWVADIDWDWELLPRSPASTSSPLSNSEVPTGDIQPHTNIDNFYSPPIKSSPSLQSGAQDGPALMDTMNVMNSPPAPQVMNYYVPTSLSVVPNAAAACSPSQGLYGDAPGSHETTEESFQLVRSSFRALRLNPSRSRGNRPLKRLTQKNVAANLDPARRNQIRGQVNRANGNALLYTLVTIIFDSIPGDGYEGKVERLTEMYPEFKEILEELLKKNKLRQKWNAEEGQP